MRYLLCILTLFLGACVMSRIDQISNQFLGKEENYVLSVLGAPDKTTNLDGNKRVLEWVYNYGSVATGGAYGNQVMRSVNAEVQARHCTTRMMIQDNIVHQIVVAGNYCYAD